MKRSGPAAVLLVWAVLFSGFTSENLLAQASCSATAELARSMVSLLETIAEKLESDEQELLQGWGRLLSGVEFEVERGSIARHRMKRASLAISNRSVWKEEEVREAVLLKLAEVDLAIDDLAESQLAEIRRLEALRASSLHGLIAIIRSIQVNQQELLRYLEDKSAARKLGDLHTSLIASAVAEARNLKAEIDDQLSRQPSDFEAEKAKIDEAVKALQSFLARFRTSGPESTAEESEPPG